jgi:hypothetical protein
VTTSTLCAFAQGNCTGYRTDGSQSVQVGWTTGRVVSEYDGRLVALGNAGDFSRDCSAIFYDPGLNPVLAE